MPHIHEKIDFTAEVLVVNKNRVLLRLHDKYKKWLSVGGHVELDEDPVEAAVREVKEEVGLSDIKLWDGHIAYAPARGSVVGYKELIPPVFMNRHNISDTHEHVTLVYFASSEDDNVVEQESEKSPGWKWCTAEDLETLPGISEHMKQYALAALKALRADS